MKILRDQLEQRVHVIHRLDRPTTGVLMFGREHEPHAFKDLRMQFELKQVKKTYWAVVAAAPHSPSRDCSEPLQKEGAAPIEVAFTQFTCLAETQVNSHAFSLLEARPQIGRYHQIRRHLQAANLPLVGDYRYAGLEESNRLGALFGSGTNMLLQARELQFHHPVTAETITIEASVEPLIAAHFSPPLKNGPGS